SSQEPLNRPPSLAVIPAELLCFGPPCGEMVLMKLLTRTYRDLQRLVGPNFFFTCGVVVALVLLEITGRQGTSDWHDAVCVAFRLVLVLAILMWHRRSPLGWVGSLGGGWRKVRRLLRGCTFELGIDLRGTPPLRRGYPPIVITIMLVLAVWTGFVFVFMEGFPLEIRGLLGQVWYLGYLAVLTAFWALLVACIVVAMLLPMAMIHDYFIASH